METIIGLSLLLVLIVIGWKLGWWKKLVSDTPVQTDEIKKPSDPGRVHLIYSVMAVDSQSFAAGRKKVPDGFKSYEDYVNHPDASPVSGGEVTYHYEDVPERFIEGTVTIDGQVKQYSVKIGVEQFSVPSYVQKPFRAILTFNALSGRGKFIVRITRQDTKKSRSEVFDAPGVGIVEALIE